MSFYITATTKMSLEQAREAIFKCVKDEVKQKWLPHDEFQKVCSSEWEKISQMNIEELATNYKRFTI